MDFFCICMICLFVFVGCVDYVIVNGYGGVLFVYSYVRLQVYDVMVNCKFFIGYLSQLSSRLIGGLFSGFQVDNGVI